MMTSSDPIADMLTRIRNAGMARREKLEMPSSKMKVHIAEILKAGGFISGLSVREASPQPVLEIALRVDRQSRSVIQGIRRVSRPGRRTYVGKGEIPPVKSGLGMSILSTSQGVMSDRKARELGIGGELLCEVW